MGTKTKRQVTSRKKRQRSVKSHKINTERNEKKPRVLVVHRGSVGRVAKVLMEDLKKMLSPYVATTIKVLRSTRAKDLVEAAKGLSLTHCVIFTRSNTGLYLKISTMPRGPTITFSLDGYSLGRDIVANQRRPASLNEKNLKFPAALIMNNLSYNSGPKHLQLISTSILQLFSKINIEQCSSEDIKRCSLWDYDQEEDCLNVRQYVVKMAISSRNKLVRKLANNAKVPDLGKYGSIDEAFEKFGAMSDSEGEEDAKIEVALEDEKKDSKPNIVEKSIRLREVGPSISMKLHKIEAGFLSGEVLYHRIEQRSEKEVASKELIREKRKQEKQKRKLEQEANVEKKKQKTEEIKRKTVEGHRKRWGLEEEEEKSGESENEADYYAEAVQEKPSEELAQRMNKRKKPDDDEAQNWEKSISEKRAKKDAEMDEKRKAMKEKYRALDAKRKSKKPSSFKKRLAKKIKTELKARKAEDAAKKKEENPNEIYKGKKTKKNVKRKSNKK